MKCPRCGYEWKPHALLIASDKGVSVFKPTRKKWAGDINSENLKQLLYLGPFKEIYLSCGHSFRYEFAQFEKGQTTWCSTCKKEVKVVKCIDTVTGKEYNRL